MAGNLAKFEMPIFDGKANFTLWQSTIQDLLVSQGLDLALEDEKPTTVDATAWSRMQKKAVSTIRLALDPQIKYNVLNETTPKDLWKKLEDIYASKSLTNRLCLKMELYSLRMEERGNLHDHINTFNQLVCQLLNAGDKIQDEEQALLLLASLPKSFKTVVQTMLIGRTSLKLDEVVAVLRENERMMRTEGDDDGDRALAVEYSERGRSRSRGNNGSWGRSKSRPRDMSNIECYYCGEKGHIQSTCPKLREDLGNLKKLQGRIKEKSKLVDEEDDSNTNVIDGDVFMAVNTDEGGVDFAENQNSWVMDSAASVHICKDKALFSTLHTKGNFGNITVGNKEKLKVEGVGSVRLKLHNGVVQTFQNVRHVPAASVNLISLGELTSQGYRYFGVDKLCKVYKGNRLILQGEKDKKKICRLIGCSVLGATKESREFEKKSRVRFSNIVEIFGEKTNSFVVPSK